MTLRAFCVLLLAAFLAVGPARAQVTGDQYSASDLETLVQPVALYPDTLLTHVLTASTEPTQLQQAYQLTQSGGAAPSDFEDAVAALMQFPDVLAMMVQNTQWTAALGYAMSVQPNDVMQAVQQVRNKARAAGNLNSSDQMTVQDSGGTIILSSPDDNTVYVPSYDVDDLYTPGAALFAWGAGVAVSSMYWSGACNWYHGFYYGAPGAYRNWYYGRPLPAGGMWGPRPAPYAGRVYTRPAVNTVNVNRINVNNARVNVNARVGGDVRVNNSVRVNNARIDNRANVNNTAVRSKPAVSLPSYNGGGNFNYERGVDSRQSSARGRQSIGGGGGGRRGGRR